MERDHFPETGNRPAWHLPYGLGPSPSPCLECTCDGKSFNCHAETMNGRHLAEKSKSELQTQPGSMPASWSYHFILGFLLQLIHYVRKMNTHLVNPLQQSLCLMHLKTIVSNRLTFKGKLLTLFPRSWRTAHQSYQVFMVNIITGQTVLNIAGGAYFKQQNAKK